MPGGGATIVHPDGRRWLLDKNNQVTAFSRPGMQAKFYGDGRLNAVQITRPRIGNMAIIRSLNGARVTVGMRPGGVQAVTYGSDRGYVQRPYPGRAGYIQRTYVVGGRTYAHVYRAYRYRGIVYYRYVPANYYPPRFYQWASNPWPRRVVYSWGAPSAPWMGFSAGYFAPAPAYPTAALWLTDFLLAENLKLAYENHQESGQPSTGAPPPGETNSQSVPLSPQVKTAISQEVQQQLGDEQAASTQPGNMPPAAGAQTPPPVLDPNQRTLVVSQNLDVAQQAGQQCSLTPGDVLYRTGDNLMPGNKVAVNIVASKAGDCPANTSTQIDVNTLQEMHNQFREQVDTGLSTLAQSQGREGLPSGPAADARPSPEGTAQPDQDADAIVAQEQKDADTAEEAATDGANGGSA